MYYLGKRIKKIIYLFSMKYEIYIKKMLNSNTKKCPFAISQKYAVKKLNK